jgi:hypothetical protein
MSTTNVVQTAASTWSIDLTHTTAEFVERRPRGRWPAGWR